MSNRQPLSTRAMRVRFTRVFPSIFGSSIFGSLFLATLGTLSGRASAQPAITNIGVFTGGVYLYAYGVSADGLSVSGQSNGTIGSHAFRWTAVGGMQDLGILSGFSDSVGGAISSDASVVVGIDHATSGNNRAFRWTAATGMQTLGVLSGGSASSANAVNADGSVVAGFSYTSGFNQGRATRWTAAGGLQNLGVVSGATASNAFGVSADGSVVVGISGDFGFRWTAGAGMQSIGLLPTADFTEAIAISPDGSAITGDSGGLAFTNDGFDAIRWTSAGGIQDLGVLAGGDTARGYSLSADTSIVVGDSNSSNGLRGFLWTPSLGMVDLNAYLPSVGIDLTGWTLTSARGISADGSAIAGYGTFNGADRAFLVSGLSIAPEPGSALLLVCGALAGTRGRRRRRVVT